MSSVARGGIAAAALLLAACASPEAECRNGIKEMKQRLDGQPLTGSGPAVEAHTHAGIAEAALATGNFDGCLESLQSARAALNASQRTNQQ